MEFVKLRSFDEYRNYQKLYRKGRTELEERIIKKFKEKKVDFIIGFCKLCEKSTTFKIHINKSGNISLKLDNILWTS